MYQGNDLTMKNNFPKIFVAVLVGCFAASVHAQLPTEGRPNDARVIVNPVIGVQPGFPAARQETRFDLNFKGGTPKQFIEAINAQSGLKVNVISSTEHTNVSLPSLEVHNATVPQVFEALTAFCSGTKYVRKFDNGQRREYGSIYTRGFLTKEPIPSENSIWHFRYDELPTSDPEPPVRTPVQVFQLAPLLKDYSIDDITTAVKTTWQMLDSSVTPELKYHSDTGLLIVKGAVEQLRVVAEVLAEVRRSGKNSTADSAPLVPPPPTAAQP